MEAACRSKDYDADNRTRNNSRRGGHCYLVDTTTTDIGENTMTLAVAFWVLMLVWLVFGFWSYWPLDRRTGGHFLLWLLLFLLGWGVFGAPIKG